MTKDETIRNETEKYLRTIDKRNPPDYQLTPAFNWNHTPIPGKFDVNLKRRGYQVVVMKNGEYVKEKMTADEIAADYMKVRTKPRMRGIR